MVDDTVDMFPDMPRDPLPDPVERLPPSIQDVVTGLRKMSKERHRAHLERATLEKAAELLVEGFTP